MSYNYDKCDICYKKYNMKLCTKCNVYWFCGVCFTEVNMCERCSSKECYICNSKEHMVKCETCNYNKICMNCIVCSEYFTETYRNIRCIYCKKNNWK